VDVLACKAANSAFSAALFLASAEKLAIAAVMSSLPLAPFVLPPVPLTDIHYSSKLDAPSRQLHGNIPFPQKMKEISAIPHDISNTVVGRTHALAMVDTEDRIIVVRHLDSRKFHDLRLRTVIDDD
jgi:hypothetical protein